MSALHNGFHAKRRSSGQAMVETVIVLPVFIFFILGTIQLTLMQQARIMLEYAAYNAARSGAVYNGDKKRMQRVALMSLIASRPSWPLTSGTALAVGPISDWKSLVTEGLKVMAEGAVMDATFGGHDASLVKVDVLSPTANDFGKSASKKDILELDFDSASDKFSERRIGQLTIRVRYFFNLAIPFANQIIWSSWWVSRLPKRATSEIGSYVEGAIRDNVEYKKSPFLAFKNIHVNEAGLADGVKAEEGLFGMTQNEKLFVAAAAEARTYYIPLYTTHTIRMQSNAFKCAVIDGDCSSAEESDPDDGGGHEHHGWWWHLWH